jgi:hypothetical protein
MRTTRIVLGCIPIAIILALTCSSAASASAAGASVADTQWFPTSGTNCDYAITETNFYNNYTRAQTNLFNVYYNDTNTIYILPAYFNYMPPSSWKTLGTNTTVIWRNSYTAISPTELNRTSSIVIGNSTYTYAEVNIYIIPDHYFLTYTTAIIVQEDNFYTATIFPYNFLDYFNCTAHIGQQISPGAYLDTNDGVQEVAEYSENITFPGMILYTFTLFADETGHVTSSALAFYTPDEITPNFYGAAVDFVSTSHSSSPGSSIPGYLTGIVLGVAAIALVSLFMIKWKRFLH